MLAMKVRNVFKITALGPRAWLTGFNLVPRRHAASGTPHPADWLGLGILAVTDKGATGEAPESSSVPVDKGDLGLVYSVSGANSFPDA